MADGDGAAEQVRRMAIKLAALAQDGLTYAVSDYDRARYEQVGSARGERVGDVEQSVRR